jgi:hypothetical protein
MEVRSVWRPPFFRPNEIMSKLSEKSARLLGSNVFCVLFLFFVCFVSFALPLLYGLPSGYDMITDIRFASAIKDGMLSGHWLPTWANDNFGFGSIGIRFYPPVAFYVLAATQMITADWFWAIWADLLFWMFLGSVGIFLLVKEWSGPAAGIIAGVVYAVVPQHLNEIFQFFLFAEFAAWAILPFCFLYLTRVCRGGTWSDVFLFATSYSLLILTHIPTTIIASFCFPIYCLVLIDWKCFRSVVVRLAASIAITIAATSFRWINIILEYNWLSHNSDKWNSGYYQYSVWLFPNVLQARGLFTYVLTSRLFDTSILMTAALTIPAIIYLIRNFKIRGEDITWRLLTAAVATSWFAFFMLSQPSKFIWDNLVFLQKIQFPWRWLSVLSMLSVAAFAVAVPRLASMFRSRERFFVYPALALVVSIILFDITQIIIPSDPIPVAKFGKVENVLASEPMFEGWWPVWAKTEALEQNTEIFAGGRTIDASDNNKQSGLVKVEAGDSGVLTVPIFYYPHWKATVNGTPVAVSPNENGVISIPLPAEAATVRLYFEEPGRNIAATWISLITWLALGLAAAWNYGSEYLWVIERRSVPEQQSLSVTVFE